MCRKNTSWLCASNCAHRAAGEHLDCWQPWREVHACAPHRPASRWAPGAAARAAPYTKGSPIAPNLSSRESGVWRLASRCHFTWKFLQTSGISSYTSRGRTQVQTTHWSNAHSPWRGEQDDSSWDTVSRRVREGPPYRISRDQHSNKYERCQHPTYKYILFLFVYMYTYTSWLRYTEPTLHLMIAFLKIRLQNMTRGTVQKANILASLFKWSEGRRRINCRLSKNIYRFVQNTLNYKTMSTDRSALWPRGVGKGSSNTVQSIRLCSHFSGVVPLDSQQRIQ